MTAHSNHNLLPAAVLAFLLFASCQGPSVPRSELPPDPADPQDTVLESAVRDLYPSAGTGMVLSERILSEPKNYSLGRGYGNSDREYALACLDQEGWSPTGGLTPGAVSVQDVAITPLQQLSEFSNLAVTSADQLAEVRALLGYSSEERVPWFDALEASLNGGGKVLIFSGLLYHGFEAEETAHTPLPSAQTLRETHPGTFATQYGDRWKTQVRLGGACVSYRLFDWDESGDFSDDQVVRALVLRQEAPGSLSEEQKLWVQWVLGGDDLKTRAPGLLARTVASVRTVDYGWFGTGLSLPTVESFRETLEKGPATSAAVTSSSYQLYDETEGF